MAREKSYFPQNENVTPLNRPFPVCQVWSYLGIEITRVVGEYSWNGVDTLSATRTIRYPNASKASKERLHKVVSKLVNNRKATIALFEGGYEVDL